jgi:hypothetical protein
MKYNALHLIHYLSSTIGKHYVWYRAMDNIAVMGWKSASSHLIKYNILVTEIGIHYAWCRAMGNIAVMGWKSAPSPLGKYDIHHEDHLIQYSKKNQLQFYYCAHRS